VDRLSPPIAPTTELVSELLNEFPHLIRYGLHCGVGKRNPRGDSPLLVQLSSRLFWRVLRAGPEFQHLIMCQKASRNTPKAMLHFLWWAYRESLRAA
jgi:hypothetical protein